MTNICLVAVLGTGLLCTGAETTVVVSDFCRQTSDEVRKLRALTDTEISALSRTKKEAIASLKRKHKKLC